LFCRRRRRLNLDPDLLAQLGVLNESGSERPHYLAAIEAQPKAAL